MRSKKITAFLMAMMFLFTVVLSACGKSGTETTDSSANPKVTESGEAEAPAAEEEANTVTTTTGSTGKTIRLAWLSGSGNKESLEKGIQKFTDETGVGVEIVYIVGNWAEYFTKIQTMIAGGDNIDCAYIAVEGFEMFYDTGLAAPIDDWIADYPEEYNKVANDMSEAMTKIAAKDGVTYALPEEWNNVCCHINTKMMKDAGLSFPDAGWDKDTFLSYCEAMTKDREDGTKQYGVAIPNYYFGFNQWLYNFGASYMNDEMTESRINSPEAVEAFQFAQDLIYKYGYAPIPETAYDQAVELINNNLGMAFWGRWTTTNYVDNDFKDVGVQYMPAFKSGVDNSKVIWGGAAVYTLNTTKDYDNAVKLALYIASPDFIKGFMTYGAIPVLNSVAEELVLGLGFPDNCKLFVESAANVRKVEAPAQYASIAELVDVTLSDILVNKADVQTALDDCAEQMNSLLMD